MKLGILYLNQGDMVRSKEKLLIALKQQPNQYMVQDAYGYFLEKTGEPKLAEQYYLKALQLASDKGEALNNYGTYLYRQNRYHEALKYFLRATADQNYLHPAKAYQNAGLAALALKNKALAKKYFKEAAERRGQVLNCDRLPLP